MKITRYHLMYKRKYSNINDLPDKTYDSLICSFSGNERSSLLCKVLKAETKTSINECKNKCKDRKCDFKTQQSLQDVIPKETNKSIALDISSFPSRELLKIMMIFHDRGIKNYDMFYVEPSRYINSEDTAFYPSSNMLSVEGYAAGTPDNGNALVIINPGYNPTIFKDFIEPYKHKKYLLTFPPTSLDMFQENYYNLARTDILEDNDPFHAPSYDPFITAFELRKIIEEYRNKCATFSLLPLATKPQLVGFGIYYIEEIMNNEQLEDKVFIYLPELPEEIGKTSIGIKNIWHYKIVYK